MKISNFSKMVSVITPCFNSEKHISATIRSVIDQTYTDWEMIIVDDCSTDMSSSMIQHYASVDSRIRYIKTDFPSGSPTYPRNLGLAMAKGRYIAFLDSDDLWLCNKLEVQIPVLAESNVAIVYSNYEKIDEDGSFSGRIVTASEYHTYKSLLYGNEIGCLTVIVDTVKTGRVKFKYIGHEDYECWLSILKKGYVAKNSQQILAVYRVRKSSVSSDKLKVMGWIWNIYRKHEQLSLFSAFYHFLSCMIKSFIKYIK